MSVAAQTNKSKALDPLAEVENQAWVQEVEGLVVVEEVMGLAEVEEEDLEVTEEAVAQEVEVEMGVDKAVEVGALVEEGEKVLLVE